MPKIYLVDMDDVLADFGGEFLRRFRKKYPKRKYIPLNKRITFDLKEQYPKKYHDLIDDIVYEKGFFVSLPKIPGGLEAITEMLKKGIEVFICTSPYIRYENCAGEKYEWIEKHLREEWIKRVIITRDKTLVKGDILIDDKPNIKGISVPSWEHILYTQPYNKNIKDKRRLTWQEDWRTILNI